MMVVAAIFFNFLRKLYEVFVSLTKKLRICAYKEESCNLLYKTFNCGNLSRRDGTQYNDGFLTDIQHCNKEADTA